MPSLLLISNSTLHGSGYLEHCAGELRDFLSGTKRVLFVPYALHDWDAYANAATEAYARLGYTLESVHRAADPHRALQKTDGIFIGGGNTFRLLNRLYEQELLDPIRRRIQEGARYIGTSAGSNVACVSIETTNDMPIVYPPSFRALNLVPFNINPHYLDPNPDSKHMGETREQRIAEFHEMNDRVVVGLREGAMLRVEGPAMTLKARFPLDTPNLFAARMARLREISEAEGRDPSTIDVTYALGWYNENEAETGSDGRRRSFTGSAAQIASDIRAYRDLGVGCIAFEWLTGSAGFEEALERMKRFVTEVRPLVEG